MSLLAKISLVVGIGLIAAPVLADGHRGPATASPVQESSNTLNVNGQVRSLSMLPTNNKDKNKLEFGKARTSYKDKVPKTIF